MNGQLIYSYSGVGEAGADATSLIKNPDKLKYILGEDGNYRYLVASRSVNVGSSIAKFHVATVEGGLVGAYTYFLCNSNSSKGNDFYEELGSNGIRPIVVLPSDIEVEKNESGQWDIAY